MDGGIFMTSLNRMCKCRYVHAGPASSIIEFRASEGGEVDICISWRAARDFGGGCWEFTRAVEVVSLFTEHFKVGGFAEIVNPGDRKLRIVGWLEVVVVWHWLQKSRRRILVVVVGVGIWFVPWRSLACSRNTLRWWIG